jgi:hypothetical protein
MEAMDVLSISWEQISRTGFSTVAHKFQSSPSHIGSLFPAGDQVPFPGFLLPKYPVSSGI